MESHIGSRYAKMAATVMSLFFVFMMGYCLGESFAKSEKVEDNTSTFEGANEENKLVSLTRKYEDVSVVVVDNEQKIEEYESNQKDNAVKEQIIKKINYTFTRPSSIEEVKSIFEDYFTETSVNNKSAEELQEILADSEASTILGDNKDEEILQEVAEGENIIINEGIPDNFIDAIDVTATAYCLCKKCTGKTPSNPDYGRTASGLVIVPGTNMKVIAVDPKLVKLGTHVYVQGLNGAADYGYAIAADTGGAIKNRKIDLYMDSHQDCLKWGRRTVRLYILPD